MKFNFKKVAAGAVTCALVASMGLVGCSSQSSSSSSTDSSSSSSTESTEEAVELQIFAANSLSKAMEEAQELYTEQTGVTFADTQYEASGTLNEMLGAGQSADILITASKGTMDTAVENGYVDESTRSTMFTNDLVIVSKEGSGLTDVTLEDIAEGKYTIAVGDENVPAGNYACQALSTVGAYITSDGTTGADTTGKGGTFSDAIADKVTLGAKVGDVCKYAETGEVDLAMVYTSDVYRIGGVEIVSTVPSDTHKSIVYPGAVTADSANAEAAQAFLDWCMTDPDCAKIWQKWGFDLA
jgi:molybdate transport system substrate-binding protein